MDELIKFLTSKIGYTLTAILGFGLPGNMLVFVWNQELYLEMNIIKLIMLSFGIAFLFFVIVAICASPILVALEEMSKEQPKDIKLIFLVSVALNFLVIIGMMYIKIVSPDYTVKTIVEKYDVKCIVIILGILIVGAILNIIAEVRKKRR